MSWDIQSEAMAMAILEDQGTASTTTWTTTYPVASYERVYTLESLQG
jgi:hypothetical protein